MKLYYTSASPFSRKVLVLAHEAGLMDRLQLIVANVGTHVPLDTPAHDELAKLNGLMKVPVLVTAQNDVLFDSRVICQYLDSLYRGPSFFPSQEHKRWADLRDQALADGIMEAALLWRFEMARQPGERSSQWWQSQRRRIIQALDQLERASRPMLPSVTIGDVGIACALAYLDFRFAELDWRSTRPTLGRWFAAFSDRPSMRLTVPRAVPTTFRGAPGASDHIQELRSNEKLDLS